jgi:hypothetical protein
LESSVIQINADCVWRSGLSAPLGLFGAEERLTTVQGLSVNVSGPVDLPAVSIAADSSNQQQAASTGEALKRCDNCPIWSDTTPQTVQSCSYMTLQRARHALICHAGWALHVERVVLQGVLLPDPGTAAAAGSAAEASLPPVLWPVNMFSSSGSSLLLRDVRLVTSLLALQQHVAFFRGQLTPQWQVYTVGAGCQLDRTAMLVIETHSDRGNSSNLRATFSALHVPWC